MHKVIISLALLVVAAGCERSAEESQLDLQVPKPTTEPIVERTRPMAELQRVPAGSVFADKSVIEFAVYLFGEVGERDFKAAAEVEAREHALSLHVTAEIDEEMKLPALLIQQPAISEYQPPDEESIQYSARGLSEEEMAKVPGASAVVVLTVFVERGDAAKAHQELLKLADRVARTQDGIVWDESTRQVLSGESWQDRLAWDEGPPNLVDHVTMHAYRDGPLIRIVTLGMEKFGLPDVVVNDVPSSSTRAMGNLINLVCQTFYERPVVENEGVIEVSIDRVDNAEMARIQQTNIHDNAERGATLAIVYVDPDEGDANNRLVEIIFGSPSEEAPVAQERVLCGIYGGEDEITFVSHDDAAIEKASERAFTAVMKLKESFADGPEVNEQLMVKAPFTTTSGGNEWMWVEVVTWTGTRIRGILANDPHDVPELQAGSTVEIEEDVIFDYIHRRPDGTQVGNETGEIIQRQQQGK